MVAAGSAGDTVEVGAVGDASAPAGAAPVACHLSAAMGDPHRLDGDQHPEGFGWIKQIAGLARPKLRGRPKLDWSFTFAAAAYNLVRLPKLLEGAP